MKLALLLLCMAGCAHVKEPPRPSHQGDPALKFPIDDHFEILDGPLTFALMAAARDALGPGYYVEDIGTAPRGREAMDRCVWGPWGADYAYRSGEAAVDGRKQRVFYITITLRPDRCGSTEQVLDGAAHYILTEEGEILRRFQAAEVSAR